VLLKAGRKGREVLHDIDVYLQGINAYLAAHNHTLGPFSSVPDFTRDDIYAFNALKDQFVGEGGGDEAVRSEFLSALERAKGAKRGPQIFDDLREANDPEAPVSVPGHVRLQPSPKSTSGNVLLDPGSLSSSAAQATDVTRQFSHHASNELIVSGKRSATHHPIMVAGPQIGYYYPGLTMAADLEGPEISQRGATTAPFPGYIFIGRSQDAAWSLTSAGLDQIDTYVETLCGHSKTRYLFKGKCRKMQFFDAGTLNPGTSTAKHVSFYRTVHGPVIGYARVHVRLVALLRKRASYGKDVLDLLFYHDLAHGLVHNVHQFFKAADQTPQTFNSFYMDDKDIGVFTSGLVLIRPANVDPALPIDGRGDEEWRGWVSFKNHPQWASSVLGSKLSAELASFDPVYESPPGGQEHGWQIYMDKDLRTILGEHVRGEYHLRYCGAGNIKRCRRLLWDAIDKAGDELAAQQGTDPSAWRASATTERITFIPGLLPFTMRYANRPTGIQQVLSFFGHAAADTGR
jgi:acyl-homoserine lactone acylase PvdQ